MIGGPTTRDGSPDDPGGVYSGDASLSGAAARTALPLPASRGGLSRLASGLIAYGVVGLLIAVAALIGLLWLATRVSGVTDPAGTQMASIVDTLDETATALSDASTSATSFSATLERTPPAVRQAATAVGDLRGNLRTIEAQLGALDLFGSQPFGNVAGQFGQMATDLEGLDTQLAAIADDLESNRAALTTNSTSLSALAERLRTISDDVQGGSLGERLDDVRLVLTVLGVLFALWIAVPAGAALWLGRWLRRELARGVGPTVVP